MHQFNGTESVVHNVALYRLGGTHDDFSYIMDMDHHLDDAQCDVVSLAVHPVLFEPFDLSVQDLCVFVSN